MRRTTRGSSIVAMTRIRPEQFGQANASTENTRWGKSAQLNVAPANRRRKRSRVHQHRLDAWAYRRGVELHFIRPGKPVDNAFIESFNG
jgi:hypothetical protein